ncbi:hypothetical protein B9Z55_016316 [Caenorhabditis nigoni]|uniref:Uncharacterized protein n=1 Tax=Caenorhabditis nigoni TaxID=1611254 RepID=A0A2G5T4R4_9PELO|nr:hypothetical protein B9Z55_016316 [Caenorhabditis nigoni]
MQEEYEMSALKHNERVGRRNDRKRDAKQANLPERSPSLRNESRCIHQHPRVHPYLPPRTNTHRQRLMIRPPSAISMSNRSLATSDYSGNESDRQLDVDEEMEGMTLDSPLRDAEQEPRPFPDKPYYWMDDYETLKYINKMFPDDAYYIMHNGKIVEDFKEFVNAYRGDSLVKYSFHLRLRGGKGGFGSLLRSFRVNKSTNKLMMRDLNGRRMASVDEEAKLKRYLEKQARKEQELKEKRKIKLAKLTAGPAKHQFEDQDYLSRREEILEKTGDAVEAGYALMMERQRQSRVSKEQEKDGSDDDGEDVEDVTDLFNERGGLKRKIAAPTIGDGDKKRVEDESDGDDSEDDSENEPDPEELEAIRRYFEEKKQFAEKEDNGEGSSTDAAQEEPEPAKRPRLDSASNVDDLPKIDVKTPCEYGPIELSDYTSAEDLELLGLEHLKSALNDRGLKCGGSLSERAARLWSVKGKALREWPKSILTPELKKKVAEEEEAERKAAKKAKKAKKN